MSSLANSLKFNRALVNLWLDGNEVDEEVIRNFADAAKFSDSLETIWLSGENVTLAAYDYFAEMLKVNETIKNVFFGGEKIDLESFVVFQEKVKAINNAKKSLFEERSISDLSSNAGKLDMNFNTSFSAKENTLDENLSFENFKNEKNEFNKLSSNKSPFIEEVKPKNESKLNLKSEKNNCNKNKKNEFATYATTNNDNNIIKKNTYLDHHILKSSQEQTKIYEGEVIKIDLENSEKAYNEIKVEKCFRTFAYLNLIESIFLKCLKCKKIFDDSDLSFIEKNFVDQINIDNENLLNDEEFFDREEFDLKDLRIARKNRNKKFFDNKENKDNYFNYEKLNVDSLVDGKISDEKVNNNIEIQVEVMINILMNQLIFSIL